MASVSTAAPPKGKQAAGGKKILGMPRRTAVIGGIALGAGVLFIIWRNHQASAGAAAGTTDAGTAAGNGSAPPDTSGLQGGGMQGATGTETLVIKIREMQGHRRRRPPPPPPPHRRRRARGGGPPRHKTSGPPLANR